MDIPAIDTEQMIEVDRLMIEEYGIRLVQMMENAGRNLAEQARRMLPEGKLQGRRIVALCGAGNNGGGGMVAARHLHNRGAEVRAILIRPEAKLKDVPKQQWASLQAIGVAGGGEADLGKADLILDAMIGYGLKGDPRSPAADWIRAANASGAPILALDAPSGLNTTTGKPGDPCIRASATMTLALPKVGLLSEGARGVVGALYLADISVPPELYRRIGLDVPPLFGEDSIVKVA